jgi:hypothetical protein
MYQHLSLSPEKLTSYHSKKKIVGSIASHTAVQTQGTNENADESIRNRYNRKMIGIIGQASRTARILHPILILYHVMLLGCDVVGYYANTEAPSSIGSGLATVGIAGSALFEPKELFVTDTGFWGLVPGTRP